MSDREHSCTEVTDTADFKRNWNKCAICQMDKDEVLQCPIDSKQADVGAGYKTLAENMQRFNEIGCMPMEVNLSRLNEGDGLENTLFRFKARWHKSCFLNFNSTKLRRAEKRKASDCSADSSVGGKHTRSSFQNTDTNADRLCYICDQPESSNKSLHEVRTLDLDARIRKCALILRDKKLLTKLSRSGYLIALEACYHANCVTSLYKRADAIASKTDDEQENKQIEGIALAELVMYIETCTANESCKAFKLSELADMYKSQMDQLEADSNDRVHTTRLKERILAMVPGLEAYKEGRDIMLAFRKDVGEALHRAYKEDSDDEAIHLTKAANIVRKNMLEMKYSFTGSFELDCQNNSVPTSLLSLVNMILYGPSIVSQTSHPKDQASLSIAQLMQYNSYIRRRDGKQERQRHAKSREAPLPIYVALSIHAKTRSRSMAKNILL